jgi:opine dehydrogenase
MKIAVLGGGHGAYAAAADLAEQGHEVRHWRRKASELSAKITLVDEKGSRPVSVRAEQDIGRSVSDTDLILIPGPATAQMDIARAMAPHVRDGQVVFLPPGTFGSYAMAQAVKAKLLWAETGTLPWLARKRGPAEVAITIRAVRLPTGVFPFAKQDQALAVIRKAFPSVAPCGNALSGALMNAGPIIHPPLILMNAGPLEASNNYDIHSEGTQPAIRAVTDRLDLERIAVREALGFGAPHYPLKDHYTSDRWMYGDAHKKLVKSGDWREHIDLHSHRYVTEDTELGLAFLASAARFAGVDAPIAHGLLAVVGGFLGRDLRRGPRTLEALGLAALERDALKQRLHDGER